MNKKTAQALEASIDHWFENLQMLELNYLAGHTLNTDIYTHSSACELCNKFICLSSSARYPEICTECPVAGKIKKYNKKSKCPCAYTPYYRVIVWKRKIGFNAKKLYEQGFAAISAELEFLISLRKK